MEKKQILRTNQVPTKVQNTEARKLNQDALGKQQTRNLRRRDFPTNFVQSQKNDRTHYNSNYQQKQQQQSPALPLLAPKPRGNDKQQRNTNHPNGDATTSHGTRLTNSYDADSGGNNFEAEMNSVYLPGSKKQNLNHLLNFNFPSRERNDSLSYQRTGNNAKGTRFVRPVKYNKELYLLANCQFVVKANVNYASNVVAANELVDWPNIEQIHFFGSSEDPQCPICLYPPVAAKMTRCGHVYCWPCILHYLALSEKNAWRKCPICYDAVHIDHLKSAVSKPHRNYSCDEHVTFQLMCRQKDSLHVHRTQTLFDDASDDRYPNMSDDYEKIKHSKLVLAKPHEILTIIERERTELECQLAADNIDPADSMFVKQALDLLDGREKAICAQIQGESERLTSRSVRRVDDLPLNKLNLNAQAKEFVPFGGQDDCETISVTESIDSNQIFDSTELNLAISDIDIATSSTTSNSSRFYFYQANDGQHLYLHPINARMLQAMFGSLEHAPHTIAGRIVQKETFSMSDDERKRFKYLLHLPVTCQFDVVEIEFDQVNLISNAVASKFRDELQQRQKMRQKRARDERRREKCIDVENDRLIGKIIYSDVQIDVTSDQQFPSCGSFDDSAFPSTWTEPSTSNGNAVPSTSTAGPSFAKMLTAPKSSDAGNWPSLSGPKAAPLFASNEWLPLSVSRISRTVSGESNRKAINEQSDDDSIDSNVEDIEATCAPPVYLNDFGSVIANALDATQIKNSRKPHQSTPANVLSSTGGNKKKKNKKMVLFSTGGHTFDGK